MKKAEAISILATSVRPREPKDRARYDKAVKMAIEALKCSEIPNSSDTISRQAAIDAMGKAKWAKERLEQLPPAQPEQKRGKWIYNSPVTMKCDQCGFAIKDWDWHRFKICPNCGADMRKGEPNANN